MGYLNCEKDTKLHKICVISCPSWSIVFLIYIHPNKIKSILNVRWTRCLSYIRMCPLVELSNVLCRKHHWLLYNLSAPFIFTFLLWQTSTHTNVRNHTYCYTDNTGKLYKTLLILFFCRHWVISLEIFDTVYMEYYIITLICCFQHLVVCQCVGVYL